MSTAVSHDVDNETKRGVKILGFDAAGPRGISQLQILQRLMESILESESGPNEDNSRRPCDVFDAIGGVGTGGLIAIFLVVLKMTVKEALTEFTQFVTDVFEKVARDPKKQTEKLKLSIDKILQKHGVDTLARLIVDGAPNPSCRLMVPVIYKNDVTSSCTLRNYTVREPSTNLTVAEAMLATCAAPPIFTPTRISKEFTTFEYISGDVALSNPTREIIAEALRAFGKEATVACLLSIGSGRPGTTAAPSGSDTVSWKEFFQRVAMDCERTAREIGSHMRELDLYHRLSVTHGLEFSNSHTWNDPAIVSTHTAAYLEDIEVQESVVRCADSIKTGAGFETLERLSQAGVGKILPSPLPSLTSTYVEREGAMRFVEQAIFDEHRSIKPGSKRVVVTGIGGCGKTQLIRKFAEKHGDQFVSVLFVDGSSKDTLKPDVVRHVRSLGGPYSQASFDESMIYLSQPMPEGQRLLVIDNVDDLDVDLSPFLPRWKAGTVIITSRNPSRGQLGPAAHLQLDVMTLDESVELLVRGMGWEWPPSESDKQAATSVAEELGCHPIALIQAISYMSKTGYSAETYISRLRSYRKQLLRDPATNQVDMRYKTAFAAFDASYELLSTKAQQFLHLLSLFDAQKFPLELVILAAESGFSEDRPYLPRGDEFKQGVECLNEMFCSSGQWNPVEFDSVVAILRNHSLLTVISSSDATLLQIHSLIRKWAFLRISAADIGRLQAAAIRLICCGAKEESYRMIQYMASHVRALSLTWNNLHANDAASFASILTRSGIYSEAEKLRQNVLEAVEHQLGKDHPMTVVASANLASSYSHLGRYTEAEILQKEVLSWITKGLGEDHDMAITASTDLASTYHRLGRYAEAESLMKEVLSKRIKMLGKDHPDTITVSSSLAAMDGSMGNHAEVENLNKEVLAQRITLRGKDHRDTIIASAHLAFTYRRLGRYTEAESLGQDVLARSTKLMGKDHRETIAASASLACTYHLLGRYTEAESLEEEVLAQSTKVLGRDHPETITVSANLASTYHRLGRYTEAESLQKEVLSQSTKLLGRDHPGTIGASANLASTYHRLGRYTEAESLQKEVLAQSTKLLGRDHPDTIKASTNLTFTYLNLGHFTEAEILQKEMLSQNTKLLGKDHPDTITVSLTLATIYSILENHAEAEAQWEEVLMQRTRLLGKDHPDTISASANLASTYHRLGRYTEAESLQTEVLAQSTKLLGRDHPDTIKASENLASTYVILGRYTEAEILQKEVLPQITKLLGKDHLDTITASAHLASIYRCLGRYTEADILEKEVLVQRTRLLGKDHPDTIRASANLAFTNHRLGRYTEVESLEQEVLAQNTKLLGRDHPDTIRASANLASTYHYLGRYAEAESLQKEVLSQTIKLLGTAHPDTIAASANMVAIYWSLGRYVEAESLGEEILNQRERLLGVTHPDTLKAMVTLACTYKKRERISEAYELADRARQIALEARGWDDRVHVYACMLLLQIRDEKAVPQPCPPATSGTPA